MVIRLIGAALLYLQIRGILGASSHMTQWDTRDFIAMHNYPVQKHTVVTSDGYILTLFRIPSSHRSRKRANHPIKPIAFLMHGLSCTSDCWVLNGPNDGLPFMMADAGYDVWLGNARGTRYSEQHKRLNTTGYDYWKFSWHEIGALDLPSMIDYILGLTKQSAVHYVGHSQGTTVFLVMLSVRPKYNQKIKSSHLLAPVAIIQKLTPFNQFIANFIIGYAPDTNILKHNVVISWLMSTACSIQLDICHFFLFNILGVASQNLNKTLIPMLLATFPGGVSKRQIHHYAQISKTGHFSFFDYADIRNYLEYNSDKPPDYPLQNIRPSTPVDFYYSDVDDWTKVEDVLFLSTLIPRVRLHHINVNGWNHIDYIFSLYVKRFLNDIILNIANGYEYYSTQPAKKPPKQKSSTKPPKQKSTKPAKKPPKQKSSTKPPKQKSTKPAKVLPKQRSSTKPPKQKSTKPAK